MAQSARVEELWQVVGQDLQAVESYLEEDLSQAEPPVREVTTHLLKAGGKRVRPALVLLSARFGDYDLGAVLPVAVAAEMIHMATLVHDDILDGAQIRRGRPTVNARWNEQISVLAGDALFARAFALLAQTGENRVVRIMADVVNEMCSGEIEQSLSSFHPAEQTEERYLRRIGKKTALFIAQSCRLGAVMARADPEVEERLYAYGYAVGLGFQIVDDVLDLTASSVVLGKAVGSDLRSGVLTLPLLHALERSPRRGRLLEIAARRQAGPQEVEEVREILGGAGSIGYALDVARGFIEEAKAHLRALPDIPARLTLEQMAEFVLQREV